MYVYFVQAVSMFAIVFLRGFQQQNVIGGKYKSAFILSYVMSAFEVIVFTLIVKAGWASVLPLGTGAAFGVVASMYVYRKLNKETNSFEKGKIN